MAKSNSRRLSLFFSISLSKPSAFWSKSWYKTRVLNQPTENALQVQHDLRKRWFYILPFVFITYSLAYLDRANYGFGAAAGLASTLHISESRNALLASLFFLGGVEVGEHRRDA